MDSRRILLFCQAPGDLVYVLTLYEQYKDRSPIRIYVLGPEHTYQHLQSLGLSCQELRYIGPQERSMIFKRVKHIWRARRNVRRLKRQFADVKGAEVYYASNEWDWLTNAIIHSLRRKNKVMIYYHYHSAGEMTPIRFSPKNFLKKAILFFVTGVRYDIMRRAQLEIICFPYRRYGIQAVAVDADSEVIDRYRYQLGEVPERSILLFESDFSSTGSFQRYRETLTEIMRALLGNGYSIYLKPHPRLGHSPFLDELPLTVLPQYLSGEFLPIQSFAGILGIETVAVAKLAALYEHTPMISLIHCFEFYDPQVKANYINYLREQSNGRIIFIHRLDELLPLLEASRPDPPGQAPEVTDDR